MIGVRKLLDFVFTQRELKILDDVMPEHTRKAIEEKKREKEEKEKAVTDASNVSTGASGGMLSSGSSGNVAIPLANGNILKIAVDKYSGDSAESQKQPEQINISEQLTKSSAWKTIEQKNCIPKNTCTISSSSP